MMYMYLFDQKKKISQYLSEFYLLGLVSQNSKCLRERERERDREREREREIRSLNIMFAARPQPWPWG